MSKQRRSDACHEPAADPRHAVRVVRSWRQQISQLDQQILQLIQQRAGLIHSAAEQAVSADEVARMGQTWQSLVNRSPHPLGEPALRAIFRELDSACRALICPTRVAYLGPEFSYSHLAAIERYGQSSQLLPVATISSVFEAVHRGDVQYGIVPIENSTDGRIVDTLEMFIGLPVCICGEVQMRIHHCLLGTCALPEVREVHSKPQALSQCRQWLSSATAASIER